MRKSIEHCEFYEKHSKTSSQPKSPIKNYKINIKLIANVLPMLMASLRHFT